MKNTLLLCTFLIQIALIVPKIMADDPAKSLEYQVKAGFTCKFTKFVNWPSSVFPEKKSRFTIGILGEDPFGLVIDDAVKNLRIKKRKFTVKRYTNPGDLDYCHILFICPSEEQRIGSILAQLGETPTLTVSEVDRFCQQGGVINFVVIKNKVRFEVNAKAARNAGLAMSTALLRIANIVDPE